MSAQKLKKKVQVVVMAKDCLLRLKFNPKVSGYKNAYQNITGSVEGEESFFEGAERELLEETGLQQKVQELDFEIKFKDRWNNRCVERAFFVYFSELPTITISEEHSEYEWKPLTKITESDFLFPSNYKAYLMAYKKLKGTK